MPGVTYCKEGLVSNCDKAWWWVGVKKRAVLVRHNYWTALNNLLFINLIYYPQRISELWRESMNGYSWNLFSNTRSDQLYHKNSFRRWFCAWLPQRQDFNDSFFFLFFQMKMCKCLNYPSGNFFYILFQMQIIDFNVLLWLQYW